MHRTQAIRAYGAPHLSREPSDARRLVGKYTDLIDSFSRIPHVRANFDALVEANRRVVPFLLNALRSHENEDVREICAEILGERESADVIPYLVEAMGDECLYVRQDAEWSIEKICKLKSSALSAWLDLDWDKPSEMRSKVQHWWDANRQFIENNISFE